MKSSILKYGGYGAIIGGLVFIVSHYLPWNVDLDSLEIFGWISILTSLSFIFFGIKHFRDQLNNGFITFRKALLIGLAISAIAGLVIGLLDIIYVAVINPDFTTEYVQHTLDGLKETVSIEEYELQKGKLQEGMKLFENPIFAGVFMFGLIFSVGIIISLISALILQRKQH